MSATAKTIRPARARKPATSAAPAPAAPAAGPGDLAAMRTLELVFFVHLQMAHTADEVLVEHGLGRPHHRVLYFAAREPGIAVGSLLSLLRISNQALARTTQQLTAKGLLEQRYSTEDRRVRRNYATAKGQSLLRLLTRRQLEQISRAQSRLSPAEIQCMWDALSVMARPEDLAWVNAHPIDLPAPPARGKAG
jgi:DNA-binding MarR family transcriptional regulator